MIKGLLYASLSNFFNRVPTGRIMNRLTKDLRELDEAIMSALWFVLMCLAILLICLTICIYTTSFLGVVPVIVITYISNRVRRYYLKTQREVSRFEKSTNSPVVQGFLSAISGLATIRAYNKGHEFIDCQNSCLDVNKKVRLTRSGL
jgi:ATP-binding cassette, subfamily C (CFTR/MRP), member 1